MAVVFVRASILKEHGKSLLDLCSSVLVTCGQNYLKIRIVVNLQFFFFIVNCNFKFIYVATHFCIQ